MIIGAEADRDGPWLVHVDIDKNNINTWIIKVVCLFQFTCVFRVI